MLSQHLPGLRPAPILALTATATPLVQDDIATQLGLTAPTHFIRSKMSCVCQFRPDALCADTQETLLELLGVHEADRDSGMIEDAHHLA
jgi:superfamily II DNA helicase RecQ